MKDHLVVIQKMFLCNRSDKAFDADNAYHDACLAFVNNDSTSSGRGMSLVT